MNITTKLMIGVALTAWFGLAASGAANAQRYSRYVASSGGYYGGTYGGGSNWMDRASQSYGGGY